METANLSLSVEKLFQESAELLGLTLYNRSAVSATDITVAELNRPGFVLTGFTERYQAKRVQILGKADADVLKMKNDAEAQGAKRRSGCSPSPEPATSTLGCTSASGSSTRSGAGCPVGRPVLPSTGTRTRPDSTTRPGSEGATLPSRPPAARPWAVPIQTGSAPLAP